MRQKPSPPPLGARTSGLHLGPPWMLATAVMLGLALLLAGCAQTPPPAIDVRTVTVNVPVAVRCIDPAKVPAPPPLVGQRLTGDAVADSVTLAQADLALRTALDQALALIGPCTVQPPGKP